MITKQESALLLHMSKLKEMLTESSLSGYSGSFQAGQTLCLVRGERLSLRQMRDIINSNNIGGTITICTNRQKQHVVNLLSEVVGHDAENWLAMAMSLGRGGSLIWRIDCEINMLVIR